MKIGINLARSRVSFNVCGSSGYQRLRSPLMTLILALLLALSVPSDLHVELVCPLQLFVSKAALVWSRGLRGRAFYSLLSTYREFCLLVTRGTGPS